ncbi:hypothetical protein Syun_022945 [Stephania yunnanensis]|uniref:RNase H type-1 domain-containing protein n=1 Tax=Stephania yunnanensis TaxID=152371 RepID=A0AAP0I3H8_9MAGN
MLGRRPSFCWRSILGARELLQHARDLKSAESGLGWVLLDAQDTQVMADSSFIESSASAEEAEALAILLAFTQCADGYRKIKVFSDAKTVIDDVAMHWHIICHGMLYWLDETVFGTIQFQAGSSRLMKYSPAV